MSEEKKDQVVIEDNEADVAEESQDFKVSEESLREDGMSDDEIEMARKNGLLEENTGEKEEDKTEESETQEKTEDKTEEQNTEQSQEINLDDLDSFEKVHDLYQRDLKTFYKLPKHVKSLYHNSKGLYKRLKEEEERRKEIEGNGELEQVKEAQAAKRLEKLRERLQNPENLTVEELQEMIDDQKRADSNQPLTRQDLEEIEQEKTAKQKKQEAEMAKKQQAVQRKVLEAEEYAKANLSDLTDGKFDDISQITDLAKEVAEKKPRYLKSINEAFTDESTSVEDTVDLIIDIARLNPKFNEAPKGEKKETDVDRMVKNSSKQKTSASISGGKGSRVISYEDLTPEDAAKLNSKQWRAIPKKHRERILSQL